MKTRLLFILGMIIFIITGLVAVVIFIPLWIPFGNKPNNWLMDNVCTFLDNYCPMPDDQSYNPLNKL